MKKGEKMKKNFVLSGLILIALFVIAPNTGFVQETKTGNIAGVVYSGGPLPGALVVVRRLSGEWEEIIQFKDVRGDTVRIKQKTKEKITYADSSGRYFFSGIEPGEYEMYARGESGLYKTETYEWRYDYKMTNAKGIKVAPDSTSIVNFGIVPGLLLVEPLLIEHEDAIIVCDSSCFFGKRFEEILYVQPVTGDPRYKTGNIAGVGPPGVYVGLQYTGLNGAQTDSLGRYFISGIKPGIYQIAASAKDRFSSTGNGIKVVAVEPALTTFTQLLKNIQLNQMIGKVVPVPFCLGKEEKIGNFVYND